ncbi:filamentous hemagglutinin N-terminal domain-containing protein [Kovacikia minuta CCNUW1]|uniref:filamentous hemagglutinin N-terminal domain-containing protein n=1 Tax=Kovacikia minuta TaxID=2931930 RepID=UPI001CCD2F6A|nr:filamentous hemagglutinin N-terminal domain-containing protein [Kovacikia minuta]UBF25601.1 filamentous hemagglutinin N-terminal domain-containing protein [Kovacikia minuta CCNUW1]
MTQRNGWMGRFGLAVCLTMGGAITIVSPASLAQVVADPSLGTTVIPIGANYFITDGTTVGNRNLFHSFSRFDVPTAGAAAFLNPLNIANIFARVTGGTPSNIQGLIYAQGNANLFLLNPSGIIFGPGAQLSISGSFVATTANAIQFPGGAEFSPNSPVNPQNSLLTVNPSAFLFSQITAQPIVNQSLGLLALDGQSLLLLGGDVTLDGGKMYAPGGQVELGGLAAAGSVDLNYTGNILRLGFPNNVPRANISIINGSVVYVTSTGGGNIAVNAQNITVGGSQLFAGIGSGSGTAK